MKVLMPLPRADFDPSEAAVSWRTLAAAGHDVVFATPDGRTARADPVMVTGIGLDFWSRVPGLRQLRLVGLALRADRNARSAYCELVDNAAFRMPLSYAAVDCADFDAVLLPGGHAQGMREYLESDVLQRARGRLLRCRQAGGGDLPRRRAGGTQHLANNGRSVLHGRRTTALTWKLEHSAWLVSRYAGRWWDRDYYRTYREDDFRTRRLSQRAGRGNAGSGKTG